MKSIPSKIDDATVICFSSIDSRHKPTGNTEHTLGNQPIGLVSGLAICQYDGESEFYLFYCDPDWKAITDTSHPTLDKAKEQAEFEYRDINQTWENGK